TYATGAHRAQSGRRPKQYQRSGTPRVFSRIGAAPNPAGTASGAVNQVNGTPPAASSTSGKAGAAAAGGRAAASAVSGAFPVARADSTSGRTATAEAPPRPAATGPATAVEERGMARYEPYLDG